MDIIGHIFKKLLVKFYFRTLNDGDGGDGGDVDDN